jgi:hypothetical protein
VVGCSGSRWMIDLAWHTGPQLAVACRYRQGRGMAMPLHDRGSLMTLDEWIALPEDNTYRYEPQEGVLLVSPRPLSR